ncbi:MAG: GNAT family N-acetyltransferase, partial [Oxalobacter sp.]|nr:GNAT family N-acetyltransferase [Oxalobacter sp.]
PPLKQTLDEVIAEYKDGLILKMVDDHNVLVGSVRAKENNGTVYVGKLMVHPDYQHQGYGTKLLTEIERYFPGKRYELFTSNQSVNNIRLYEKVGYRIFNQKAVNDHLTFVYMEKE